MMIKSIQKKEEGSLSKKAKSQAPSIKTEKSYSQPSEIAGRISYQINPVSQLKTEAASPLPSSIRQRVEETSGLEIKGVKVHYHSSAPAQLQALAYTKGNDIYLGKGQEKYLSHEAWHVAQQMQGRVAPQFKIGGEPVNHDSSLEKEADSFAKGELLHHQTAVVKQGSVRTAGVAQGVLRIGLNPLAVSEKKIDQQNILSEADKVKAKVLIRDKKWHWYWSMSTLRRALLKMPSGKNVGQNQMTDLAKGRDDFIEQPQGISGSSSAVGDKALRKQLRTAARMNISKSEIDYFKRYSAEAGPGKISEYTAMNNALREAGPKKQMITKSMVVTDSKANISQKLGSKTFDLINQLSEVINRTPLPNALTVYRGGGLYILGTDNVKKYESSIKPSPNKENDLVGSEIKEYGFMSTSLDEKVANQFAQNAAVNNPKLPAATCKLTVPKGSAGVFLSTSFKDKKIEAARQQAGESQASIKADRIRLTKFKKESEVLLDKGKRIKLTAYRGKDIRKNILNYEGKIV